MWLTAARRAKRAVADGLALISTAPGAAVHTLAACGMAMWMHDNCTWNCHLQREAGVRSAPPCRRPAMSVLTFMRWLATLD